MNVHEYNKKINEFLTPEGDNEFQLKTRNIWNSYRK